MVTASNRNSGEAKEDNKKTGSGGGGGGASNGHVSSQCGEEGEKDGGNNAHKTSILFSCGGCGRVWGDHGRLFRYPCQLFWICLTCSVQICGACLGWMLVVFRFNPFAVLGRFGVYTSHFIHFKSH